MSKHRVLCSYNDRGAWCTNTLVKRSLWGIGARCCTQYPYKDGTCEYQTVYEKPPPPPPPPPKRIIREDIVFVCPKCKKDS